MATRRDPKPLSTIGWREWLRLPQLGVDAIKAKVDTGARSSSLHAFGLRAVRRGARHFVRFVVHPLQRSTSTAMVAEAPILEYRRVRTSGGHDTMRPVILTEVELLGARWTIELTLVSRDAMGFRMLLGRQAIRRRFVVDPGRSYLNGKPSQWKTPTALPPRKREGG